MDKPKKTVVRRRTKKDLAQDLAQESQQVTLQASVPEEVSVQVSEPLSAPVSVPVSEPVSVPVSAPISQQPTLAYVQLLAAPATEAPVVAPVPDPVPVPDSALVEGEDTGAVAAANHEFMSNFSDANVVSGEMFVMTKVSDEETPHFLERRTPLSPLSPSGQTAFSAVGPSLIREWPPQNSATFTFSTFPEDTTAEPKPTKSIPQRSLGFSGLAKRHSVPRKGRLSAKD